MFWPLIAVQIIVSFFLIVVVLLQSSKGGGLAGAFGGGNVGMVFGVRRTADFLMKSTQVLASAFIVLSLLINLFFLPRTTSEESVIQQGAPSGQQQQSAPVPQLPPSSVPQGQ